MVAKRSARSQQRYVSPRLPIVGLVLMTLSVSAAVVLVLSRLDTPHERFIAQATAICVASRSVRANRLRATGTPAAPTPRDTNGRIDGNSVRHRRNNKMAMR